jgi:hypothetical protein
MVLLLLSLCNCCCCCTTGVLLAISTVLSHNVGTIAIKAITPSKPITQAQLMLIVRCSVPIVAIIAAVVASTYNETGYLIVVAFDVSTATLLLRTLSCCARRCTRSSSALHAQAHASATHYCHIQLSACTQGYVCAATVRYCSHCATHYTLTRAHTLLHWDCCTTDCTGWHYCTTASISVHT